MSSTTQATKALQDIRKMKRAIKLRDSTDPAVVGALLENILREALMARQALGPGRLGNNAVREIRSIRNDLISGQINAGAMQSTFLARYTAVYNELKDIEQEEKKENQAQVIKEAKQTVRSLIPSREVLTSALIAANPAVGYGFKIGSGLVGGLMGRGGARGSSQENRIKKLTEQFESEESILQEDRSNDSMPETEQSVLAEKLELIRQEIHNLRDPVDRIQVGSELSLERLGAIESETELANRLERMSQQQAALMQREAAFEAFRFDPLAGPEEGGRDTFSESLSERISEAISGGGSTRAAAGGAAAGSVLGRVLGGATLLGLGKGVLVTAIVGGASWFLWENRDSILKAMKETDVGGVLGVGGGTSGIRSSIDSSVADINEIFSAAESHPAVISAKAALESTEEHQAQYQRRLEELRLKFDDLIEQSEVELQENGAVSQETREAMLENNEEQKKLRGHISGLDDRIKELSKILREITVRERAAFRDSRSGSPIRSSSFSGNLEQFIMEKEGFRSEAYLDAAGVWTIGYGSTRLNGRAVRPGDSITEEEAIEQMRRDMAAKRQAVMSMVGVDINESQLDALTSFAYNFGTGALRDSTLLEKLNEGDIQGAAAEFDRWTHARVDGQMTELPGLVSRRAQEREMFLSGRTNSDIVSENLDANERSSRGSGALGMSPGNLVNNTTVNNMSAPTRSSPPSPENHDPTWRERARGVFSSIWN